MNSSMASGGLPGLAGQDAVVTEAELDSERCAAAIVGLATNTSVVQDGTFIELINRYCD